MQLVHCVGIWPVLRQPPPARLFNARQSLLLPLGRCRLFRGDRPGALRVQTSSAVLDEPLVSAGAPEALPLRDFHIGLPYGILCLLAAALGGGPPVGLAGAAVLGASWRAWGLWRRHRAFPGFLHWFAGALIMVAYQLGALASSPAMHPAVRLLMPATILAGAIYALSASSGAPGSKHGSALSPAAAAARAWPGGGSGGGKGGIEADSGSGGGGGEVPLAAGVADGKEGSHGKQGGAPRRDADQPAVVASLRPAALGAGSAAPPAATNLQSPSAFTTGGAASPAHGKGAAPLSHSAADNPRPPAAAGHGGGRGPAAAVVAAAAVAAEAAGAFEGSEGSRQARLPAEGAVVAQAAVGLHECHGGGAGVSDGGGSGEILIEPMIDQAVIDHAVHVAFEHERESMTEMVTQVVEQEMAVMEDMVTQAVGQAMNDVHFDVKANFNTLIVITGVILYWRGIWTAWDVLFGFSFWSEVACVGIGLGVMILFRLLKIPLAEGFPSG